MLDTPTSSATHQSMAPQSMAQMAQMPSMALVSYDQVTHRAVASGDWSNPNTWEGGQVPPEGARVLIPEGVSVKVDTQISEAMKTVRIDGTLEFATDRNTELKVDTLVSAASGHLIVGTAENPIAANVVAKITITDDGPIDQSWDPSLISRGALLHGKTEMNGAEKTGFEAVVDFPMAGDTSLTLKQAPTGWQVGDEIVIASTHPTDPTQDDRVTITQIDGATVQFDRPLSYDHAAPRADLEVHVANMTRNIEVSSANEAVAHRGHVMVMHSSDVDISNVEFDGLGRSDKSIPYDDLEFPDLDPTIPPIDLGGDNIRGRYAFHVHQTGTDPGSEAVKVSGSVVDGSPGWGFVNHSSNVDFTGNVAYDVTGAAYYTEAGDEIGSFKNNIALRTVNPNDPLNSEEEIDPDTREERQDYGFQGDGFWFHGPNVQVEGNVVAGASGHAYIWWPEGLLEKAPDGSTRKVLHNAANVPNGDLIGDDPRMQPMDVPIGSFDGNAGYGTTKGIQIYYLHTEFFGDGLHIEDGTTPPPAAYDAQLRSTLSDTVIWNVEQTAVALPYANKVTLENLTLVNDGSVGTVGVDLAHFMNEQGLEVKNISIDGFEVGMKLTTEGEVTVEGGSVANSATELQYIDPDEDSVGTIVAEGKFDEILGTVPISPPGEDDDPEEDDPEDGDPEDGDPEEDDPEEDDPEEDDPEEDDPEEDDPEDGDPEEDDPEEDDPEEDDPEDDDPEEDDPEDDDPDIDVIEGTNGADVLKGTHTGDLIEALRGHDTVHGLKGDDDIFGGSGRDVLKGGNGDDALFGENGDDTLLGHAGDDEIAGGAGSDMLKGGAGNDELFGGIGRDTLKGGQGNDALSGDKGNDVLLGHAGDDILEGGSGHDVLFGGAGSDVFVFGEIGRDKVMDFNPDEDTLEALAWGVDGFEDLTIATRGQLVEISSEETDAVALLRFDQGWADRNETQVTEDMFLF